MKFRMNRHSSFDIAIGIIAFVLFLGLLYLLFVVGNLNLKPYVMQAVKIGVPATIDPDYPIIGAIGQRLGWGMATVAGFIAWCFIQLMECIWIVVEVDDTLNRAMLRHAMQIEQEIANYRGASEDIRRKARRMRRVPHQVTDWAALLALFGYGLDIAIGINTYPIWKNWDCFIRWTKTLNPMWINAGNLWSLAFQLFTFEVVLIVVLLFAKWIFYRNKGV